MRFKTLNMKARFWRKNVTILLLKVFERNWLNSSSNR